MARLVLKFGGTSVASIARLEHAASFVAREYEAGNEVVVVVSAMAGFTNQLVDYTQTLCPSLLNAHNDVVLAAGEQVTTGLMALALQKRGIPAQAFLGWQVPIQTDDTPSNAKITAIPPHTINAALADHKVVVVAGFQGVSSTGAITTLGRGGSDTTAVALAAALNADRCDIYTDVDGIYTADPRIVPRARKLKAVSSAEMFEMAAQGAKVLQARSVEIAMKYRVKLRVLSSFIESEGTTIVYERSDFESTVVSGIAHCDTHAHITLVGVPASLTACATLFTLLSDAAIPVDMVVTSPLHNEAATVCFTVPKTDLTRLNHLLTQHQQALGFQDVCVDNDVVKISVVGVGLNSNKAMVATLLQTLAEKEIPLKSLVTSEVKLSVLVEATHLAKAATALHTAYGLDEPAKEAA